MLSDIIAQTDLQGGCMMEPMIRQAVRNDLPGVISVINAAHKALEAQGFVHWAYYNFAKLSEIVERGELYVMQIGQAIVGTIRLSKEAPDYFAHEWAACSGDPDKCLYIGTVGIHPKYQGQGLSSQLMQYAENMARLWNRPILRLDAREEVPLLIARYIRRGYAEVTSYVEEGTNATYILMQKPLLS